MSRIVKYDGLAYLCDQVGDGATVAAQSADFLSRVDALLKKAGSDRKHILQAIIWLADMSDFAEVNEVWDAWVPTGFAAARACGKARLAGDALKVEVIITTVCSAP